MFEQRISAEQRQKQQAKCDRLLKKYNKMSAMVPPPIRSSVYATYCKELDRLDEMKEKPQC